jgi:hypothetical protein
MKNYQWQLAFEVSCFQMQIRNVYNLVCFFMTKREKTKPNFQKRCKNFSKFPLISLWPNSRMSSSKTIFFFNMAPRSNVSHCLLIPEICRSHIMKFHIREDYSGWEIDTWQTFRRDKTQHLQQTNILAPGGIRIHDLSRRTAADLRLTPWGHWN